MESPRGWRGVWARPFLSFTPHPLFSCPWSVNTAPLPLGSPSHSKPLLHPPEAAAIGVGEHDSRPLGSNPSLWRKRSLPSDPTPIGSQRTSLSSGCLNYSRASVSPAAKGGQPQFPRGLRRERAGTRSQVCMGPGREAQAPLTGGWEDCISRVSGGFWQGDL